MKTHIVWLLMALTLMLSASQVPTRAATNSTSVGAHDNMESRT